MTLASPHQSMWYCLIQAGTRRQAHSHLRRIGLPRSFKSIDAGVPHTGRPDSKALETVACISTTRYAPASRQTDVKERLHSPVLHMRCAPSTSKTPPLTTQSHIEQLCQHTRASTLLPRRLETRTSCTLGCTHQCELVILFARALLCI